MAETGTKFDDIEMLEIPDDESTSSETESMSAATPTDEESEADDSSEPQPRTYIELKDWIQTDAPIEFQFDSSAYKRSASSEDVLDYGVSYVNSLFKAIEGLSSNNVKQDDIYKDDDFNNDDDEVIGVITDAPDIGKNSDTEYKNKKINEAYTLVIENFSEYVSNIKDSVDEGKLDQYYGLLSILDCLLANYFYPSLSTKPELLSRWINRYDHKPFPELVEAIMINTPKPYLHPEFWNNYLPQLVTRGLVNEAVEAIQGSKYEELKDNCESLYLIIQDLSTLLSNYTNSSLKGQFSQWKLSACEFRDTFTSLRGGISESRHHTIANQIYEITCIITGLPKTIARFTSSWYEVFVALSLYHIRDEEKVYSDYYKMAIEEIPLPIENDDDEDDETYVLVEKAFSDIMEKNFLKVLETISYFHEPTAAYVAKLLELKGLLSSYYSSLLKSPTFHEHAFGKTVSEYLLTKHAYECLNEHSLVPVGIGLLLHNDLSYSARWSVNNRKVISKFLPYYECKTNDDLEWALTICAKINLVSTAKKLYLKYGKKSLKDGYIYEALNMFVKCYDPDSHSEESVQGMKLVHEVIWDTIFQDSLINNRPIEDELINNIVLRNVGADFEVHPVIKQCLSPYAVLVEFFQSLTSPPEGNAMKNLSRLVHLIRFTHLPKKFSPLLLAQILPFFYEDRGLFQLPDLIIITELIDNYESQVIKKDAQDAGELYKFSITHLQKHRTTYDWRVILQENQVEIPEDVSLLLKSLRNEIVVKLGKVFIGK